MLTASMPAISEAKIPWKYLQARRVVELFLIVLLSPLLIIGLAGTALLLLVADRGPVFFIQKRPGRGGKLFPLYKFRTMFPAASQAKLTARGDRRITPIGRLLRRTKLDELPQLLNVLRGDMSLIGPRPVPENFYQLYLKELPGYDQRHRIRPGITGLAQVQLGYTETLDGERQKLGIDLHYIQHISPALDLKILRDTFFLSIPAQPKA